MANALWITLIGMGLVFVAILLLWGLMVLLVRVTAERTPVAPPAADLPVEAAPEAGATPDLRRRAAAAAVAAALAFEKRSVFARTPASHGAGRGSDWQTVQRAAGLNQRANLNRNR